MCVCSAAPYEHTHTHSLGNTPHLYIVIVGLNSLYQVIAGLNSLYLFIAGLNSLYLVIAGLNSLYILCVFAVLSPYKSISQ